MRGFLEPRSGPLGLVSRFETGCLLAAFACLATTWPLADRLPTASGLVTGAGVSLLAAGLGSFVRGLQWRRLLSRHAVDPNVTVYYERGDYARLVERVVEAEQVDLVGISLTYVLEYIKDHLSEYVHRVRHTRILLPATRGICDDRDAAQGTQPGGLWSALGDSHQLLA